MQIQMPIPMIVHGFKIGSDAHFFSTFSGGLTVNRLIPSGLC